MKKTLLSLAFLSLASLSFAQKATDFTIMPSQVKEAKDKGNIKLADSIAEEYIDNYLFKLKEDVLMTKSNLQFICENLKSTNNKAFNLFFQQRNRINSILGTDKAEYAIKLAITRQFIPKFMESDLAIQNWDAIQNEMMKQFGILGEEVIYGRRMWYYANVKDWQNFGKYYILYFKRALKRPEYNINTITWLLFENVNDPKVLKFACDKVMKYAMEEWYQNDVESWDTYANLLYKTGKRTEAIEWEGKAVQMKKGQPDEKLYTDALDKMRKGLPTWNTPTSNP